MTKAIMFPGQGSQALGMGKDLFAKYPEHVAVANSILDFDIVQLCTAGPVEKLNSTDNTQVAIFFVNALHHFEWKAKHQETPDFLLGHSIGEYNALFAADMISFTDALRLVKLRGELMAKQRGGAMAAIMKLSSQELSQSLRGITGGELVEVANYNSEYQTVVSSSEKILNQISPALQEMGALVVRLNTSGAFHSRHMENARIAFQEALEGVAFKPARIPVISNVTAEPLHHPQSLQAAHLTSPVKWYQSIYYILDIDESAQFVECGWGSTLSNILRYNRKEYMAQKVVA